jgi:hypothetical protein
MDVLKFKPGTKVWQASFPLSGGLDPYLGEGVATDVIVDGQQMVRIYNVLVPAADRNPNSCPWRDTKTAARRDIHGWMVRRIGKLQAEADKLADELLHEDLTAAEAA